MEWTTLFDEDFFCGFKSRSKGIQKEVLACTRLLRERGPHLGRPYVDTLAGTTLTRLKEFRLQYKGEPWRILFAFDPKRHAILLVGGNKGKDKRWYQNAIPLAEKRFRRHLEKMEKENGYRC